MNRSNTINSAVTRRGLVLSLSAATAVAFGSFTLAAGADQPLTIRSIAPTKSFFLLTSDDVRGSVERFKKTPLHDLWESETVQSAVAKEWKEFEEKSAERLRELGLPEDTMSWPVNFGIAVHLERNEEIDELEPAFVMLADWGDGADKMSAFFDASFEEMAKEDSERITTRDIRGRKATIMEMEEDAMGDGLDGSPLEGLGGVPQLVYVRDGTRFMLGSSVDAIEDALTAIDVPPTKLVTDEDDARDALAQLGGGDIYALLRTGPLQPLVQETGGGMMAMASPLLTRLFGDVQAYGFSATLDGPVGQVDSAITIFSPEGRKGLLALLTPRPLGASPAIVPADAIGYGHMNIAFGEVMKIVESTVAGLPEMYAENVEPMLQAYGPTLTRAFAAMGPELHTFTTVSQPITEESQQTTVAIACSDEQAVLPLINLFGPQIGLQSRDFLGQTIFSGEGIPMAVGLGGGHLVIGTPASVEQALRSTGQGGSPDARSGAEKAAMSLLPARPVVGWGWFDTVAGFEVTRQLALSESGNSQMDDFVDEGGDAIGAVTGTDLPVEVVDIIRRMDPEFLAKYLGPQLWQFTAEEKGLVYRFSLLRPATSGN